MIRAQGAVASSTSVAYFYCKDGDSTRDSCDAIVRGVLAQLLLQNSDIVPYFNSHKVALVHDPLKSDGLRSLVTTIFKILDFIYLVVDGLDEIDRSERERFFHLILPLVKCRDSRVDGDGGYRVKLFISSRGEDDIRKSLDSIGQTSGKYYEISRDDNHKDVSSYVCVRTRELQNKFRLDDDRVRVISKHICERAGGAYNHCSISGLQPQLMLLILESHALVAL